MLLICSASYCQTSISNFPKSSLKIAFINNHKEDTLKKQFEAKGLKWPVKYIYIRSFKYDAELEVWARNSLKESFKLFKTYKVCMHKPASLCNKVQEYASAVWSVDGYR